MEGNTVAQSICQASGQVLGAMFMFSRCLSFERKTPVSPSQAKKFLLKPSSRFNFFYLLLVGNIKSTNATRTSHMTTGDNRRMSWGCGKGGGKDEGRRTSWPKTHAAALDVCDF